VSSAIQSARIHAQRPTFSGFRSLETRQFCTFVSLRPNSVAHPLAPDLFRWLTAREGVMLCGQSLELQPGGLSEPEKRCGRR
jgi:hypothetical protein